MEGNKDIIAHFQRRSRAWRQEKVNSLLKQLVSSFLMKEKSQAIITITRLETSKDLKSAKIFISIFPESEETGTIKLLKSKTGELREFIGSHIKMKFLPHLEFEIDKGEKERYKIEKILGQVAPPATPEHSDGGRGK